HHERSGCAGARHVETNFDAAAAARIRRFDHAGAGARGLRTLRRLRGARGRRDWGSHGGDRAGTGFPGEVRRGFANRNAAQLCRLPGAGEEFLSAMVYPIVKFGDPVLEREADDVTEFDTPELHEFVEDMFQSM